LQGERAMHIACISTRLTALLAYRWTTFHSIHTLYTIIISSEGGFDLIDFHRTYYSAWLIIIIIIGMDVMRTKWLFGDHVVCEQNGHTTTIGTVAISFLEILNLTLIWFSVYALFFFSQHISPFLAFHFFFFLSVLFAITLISNAYTAQSLCRRKWSLGYHTGLGCVSGINFGRLSFFHVSGVHTLVVYLLFGLVFLWILDVWWNARDLGSVPNGLFESRVIDSAYWVLYCPCPSIVISFLRNVHDYVPKLDSPNLLFQPDDEKKNWVSPLHCLQHDFAFWQILCLLYNIRRFTNFLVHFIGDVTEDDVAFKMAWKLRSAYRWRAWTQRMKRKFRERRYHRKRTAAETAPKNRSLQGNHHLYPSSVNLVAILIPSRAVSRSGAGWRKVSPLIFAWNTFP